jgi:MFS family permease
MPALLLSVQRDNWLSNLVPRGTLGRYLGQRLAVRSAFYLGSFYLLGYLLDAFKGDTSAGFVVIFTIAFLAAFVDFLIFTFMHEPKVEAVSVPRQKPEPVRFGLFDYLGELKKKKLDTFITFTSLFYLTVGLSGPIYAVYMLQELHLSYLSFTMILSAEYLARIVSVPFWGRLADSVGNIRVLGIVSRVIPLIPICWLFGSNIGYLAFVQVLSGICWGAYDLSTQSYLYKVAPHAKKLRYIVYTRCLVLLCTALGGLLGAYFVKGIFLTFGSQILSIFLVSGIFRGLVVMAIMPRLVDLAVSLGKPSTTPEVDWQTLDRVIASKRGLFYRRQPPVESMMKAPYNDATGLRKMNMVASRDKPSYQRRNWVVLEASARQNKEPGFIKTTASRRAWYRRPGVPASSIDKKPVWSLQEMQKNLVVPKSRPGLYYNDVGWADYLKDTLRAIVRDKKTNFAVQESRVINL